MNMNIGGRTACTALSAGLVLLFSAGAPASGEPNNPIVVQRMGSIFAGGTLITAPGVFDPTVPNPFGTPAGQTLHADAVYAG